MAKKQRTAIEIADDALPEDVLKTKRIYNRFFELYTESYQYMMDQIERIKKEGEFSNPDLTDIGFLWRELENLLDDARKEAKAKKELISKILAMRKTREFMDDPSIDLTVHGKIAYGSPNVRQVPGLPRPGTPHYKKLCDHFEIPDVVASKGLVKFSFNELADYLTGLGEDGVNAPEGVRTYPVYSMTYRRKK